MASPDPISLVYSYRSYRYSLSDRDRWRDDSRGACHDDVFSACASFLVLSS